jgi:predicted cation transporter
MKPTSTSTHSTSTLKKTSNESLWKFSLLTWLLLAGILLLNIGCFLPLPSIVKILGGFFSLFDVRKWQWWYFLILIVVIIFSIRWYRLYRKYINNDFDPQSSYECKWFCILSGTITVLLSIFIFLYRFSLLGTIYRPIYFWFGYADFSFAALFICTLIIAIIVSLTFLTWKWITTLTEY